MASILMKVRACLTHVCAGVMKYIMPPCTCAKLCITHACGCHEIYYIPIRASHLHAGVLFECLLELQLELRFRLDLGFVGARVS